MSTSIMPAVEVPFVVHFGALSKKFDDADFYQLCQANQDLRIERTSDGDIIIMPPAGGETGNATLTCQYPLVPGPEQTEPA